MCITQGFGVWGLAGFILSVLGRFEVETAAAVANIGTSLHTSQSLAVYKFFY